MLRRSVLCLVCGLLVTCVLVFVAYRYLLSSSSETEVEHREQDFEHRERQFELPEQNVGRTRKRAKMSTWKVSDAGSIPDNVLNKVDAVTVEEKTATFNVDGHVSLSPDICCQIENCFSGYICNSGKSRVTGTTGRPLLICK